MSRVLRVTLIIAGLIVGRWWMLVVGPVISIALFIYRCKLILPGPEFFYLLAVEGAIFVAIGLGLRKAGQAGWRSLVAAWLRWVWPRLGDRTHSFLTMLRPPLRLSIVVTLVWPLLYFGLWFFLHPPRRSDPTPIPTLPLQVVEIGLYGIVGYWVGHRTVSRHAGGIWMAMLGALAVVLVTEAAPHLLFLPFTAIGYFFDWGGPSWVPQYLQQLATSAAVSSACATLGARAARARRG